MAGKDYHVAEADEVFSAFFMNYMQANAGTDGLEKKDILQIMKQIEQYEDKHRVTFLQMMGDSFLVFRKN